MMTPTSPLRLALLFATVTVLLLTAGCRKLPTFFRQPAPSASSQHTAPKQPTADPGRQTEQVVTAYLTALDGRDYATAYELLSRDSQTLHSRANFEQQGKQGMPSFDLTSAKATVTGDTALVQVAFLEEPNTAGFHLVREDGAWKILYRGGIPGMPYPDIPSGGPQKGDTR